MAPTASGADDSVDAAQNHPLPRPRNPAEKRLLYVVPGDDMDTSDQADDVHGAGGHFAHGYEPAVSTAIKGLIVGVAFSIVIVAVVLGLVTLVMAP